MKIQARALSAVGGALLVGAAAVASGGTTAVTTAGSVTNGGWRVVTTTTLDRRADVDLTDRIALAASGTTTKTLMKGSCAVANLKTWWSNYTGGGNPYLEYHNTSWNVPGSCGDPYGNFQLQFNSNNGNLSGWFTLSDDETIPQSLDTTGAATSKVLLGYPCPSGPNWGYHTIVTAPWGTDQILAPC
jgi:hypothetical protein